MQGPISRILCGQVHTCTIHLSEKQTKCQSTIDTISAVLRSMGDGYRIKMVIPLENSTYLRTNLPYEFRSDFMKAFKAKTQS